MIGIATAGMGGVSVAFTSASTGGTARQFTATSSPGGLTGTCTASPCFVTGLIPGVAYTFTVAGNNLAGDSPASLPSNSVVLATVPGAPTGVSAVAGNGSATVSFTAPASNGGSAITGYTVTSSPGGLTSSGCTASPCTVNGLTNGTAYTFTVTASNAVGPGPASAPSTSVVPATVPGAPTGVSAVAGNGSATVSFTAPASNGGSAITGYTVTCSAAGQPTRSADGAASPIVVTGLNNGVSYSCSVVARNALGASIPSAAVVVALAPRTEAIPSGSMWSLASLIGLLGLAGLLALRAGRPG